MRKIYKTIVALCLSLTICLSASACSLFKSTKGPGIVGDSQLFAQDVVLGTNPQNKTAYSSFADAYAAVSQTGVAIYMENDLGTSAGSGTIIEVEDGNPNTYYVLTCHHVIGEMGKITVYVPDNNGKNYTDENYNLNYAFTGEIGPQVYLNNKVVLVGGDYRTDVAVLKITVPSGITLKQAKIPSSNYSPRIGEQVFAIGNPTGKLPGTMTCGNLAYIFRQASFEGIGALTLYQINVDIYHGNSGGGLYNMYGEIIGITNGGRDFDAESETCYSGINYSIPYKVTEDITTDTGFVNIAKQLIGTANEYNYGYISGRRGSFGFTVNSNTVESITAGSVAEQAGLKVNDVITSANGTTVSSNADLRAVVDALLGGDQLTLTVKRGFQTKTITMIAPQLRFCDTGNYSAVQGQDSVQDGE